MSNPIRLKIIQFLLTGEEYSVTTINRHIRISQPSLSQHLKILHTTGIIERQRHSREVYYCLKSILARRIFETLEEG